ncbi:MAG: hypothetical protein ABIR53_07300 [Paraperlucidibaca sp.]
MADPAFDFFSNAPIHDAAIVQLPPEPSAWLSIGGPIALILFFFAICFLLRWFIPYKDPKLSFSLRDLPVAAQRGIGLSTILFGLAFFFGLAQVHYQIGLHGSTDAYFANMSQGKLIAFTHAHLFGFTTAIFIIGIPFSMHFNRLNWYQWVFPAALAAALTDIVSWWGIKYISPNFDYVTMACGAVYGGAYLWMLIGMIRVIFFPNLRWFPDYLNEQRARREP